MTIIKGSVHFKRKSGHSNCKKRTLNAKSEHLKGVNILDKTTQNKSANCYVTKSGSSIYNVLPLQWCHKIPAYPSHVCKVKPSVRQME